MPGRLQPTRLRLVVQGQAAWSGSGEEFQRVTSLPLFVAVQVGTFGPADRGQRRLGWVNSRKGECIWETVARKGIRTRRCKFRGRCKTRRRVSRGALSCIAPCRDRVFLLDSSGHGLAVTRAVVGRLEHPFRRGLPLCYLWG